MDLINVFFESIQSQGGLVPGPVLLQREGDTGNQGTRTGAPCARAAGAGRWLAAAWGAAPAPVLGAPTLAARSPGPLLLNHGPGGSAPLGAALPALKCGRGWHPLPVSKEMRWHQASHQ